MATPSVDTTAEGAELGFPAPLLASLASGWLSCGRNTEKTLVDSSKRVRRACTPSGAAEEQGGERETLPQVRTGTGDRVSSDRPGSALLRMKKLRPEGRELTRGPGLAIEVVAKPGLTLRPLGPAHAVAFGFHQCADALGQQSSSISEERGLTSPQGCVWLAQRALSLLSLLTTPLCPVAP